MELAALLQPPQLERRVVNDDGSAVRQSVVQPLEKLAARVAPAIGQERMVRARKVRIPAPLLGSDEPSWRRLGSAEPGEGMPRGVPPNAIPSAQSIAVQPSMAGQKPLDFGSRDEDAPKSWQFPKHLAADESADGLFADAQRGCGAIDAQRLAFRVGRCRIHNQSFTS